MKSFTGILWILNMPTNDFEWEGDLNDDCSFRTKDNYFAHVECMGFCDCAECRHDNAGDSGMCEACGATLVGDWYFAVEDTGAKETVYHSTEDNVAALTGESARMLCEVIVIAHRAGWRR